MEQRGFVFHAENLLSPSEALATFFARVQLATPQSERVPLARARGRILASDVHADDDYPNAPRSAMDGFAVASADLPATLPCVGEIAMGAAWPHALERGTVLRIPTGGVVPDGADAVVPIEDATLHRTSVHVDRRVRPGENVNERASDMRRGEIVLRAGRRIDAPAAGVLATLGVVEVPVYRVPSFAVFSSGDELVAPDSTPKPGEIRDSNRYAIGAALEAMGARAVHFPTLADRPGVLETALRDALGSCDGAIVTGGSSVGERDLTPGAIDAVGKPGVVVHGLRVKPGKPTVLAAIGTKPVIGLPGNPTSALMILEAVAAPVVAALTGFTGSRVASEAVLAAPVRSRKSWTWYVPVAIQHEARGLVAQPLPLRSSAVSLTARADGYVIVGESDEELQAGARVTVWRFQ